MNELDQLFEPIDTNAATFEPVPAEDVLPTPEQPMFPEGSLGATIGEDLQGRVSNVQESARMMAENEQTYLEAAAQGFGQVLMGFNDVVSDTALEILSTLTTDEAESWLKEQINTGAEKLMDTNTAQALYNLYRGLDDRGRKDIDAAVNIGLSMLPMKSKIGSKLMEAGVAAEKKSLGRYLLDQSPLAKKARLAEEGMEKAAQTTLNREDAILNTVMSIKGITDSTPRKKMMVALNTEVARLGVDIKRALSQVEARVPKGTVTRRLNTALAEFKQAHPEYAGKDLKHIVEKVQRAYLASNKKYNGRPEELLEVRKTFDRVVERFFGKDVHAGDHTSRPVVAHLRNELNKIMQEVAPDAKIRDGMQRQHHALIAKDNLAFNMAMEKSPVDKALAKIEHHPFMVGGLISGTGMGANLLQSEALGVAAGTAGLGYLATKPSVLKGAGATLEATKPAKSLLVDMLTEYQQQQQQ